MKKLWVLFMALSLAALPAQADRGHRHGGHHSHHDHRDRQGGDGSVWAGLAIVGALAGLAIMAEQSRPRYAAPAYVEPAYPPQPAYAEPPSYSASEPAAAGTWYYCQSSAMYYPNTRACPEGWQAVQASPY